MSVPGKNPPSGGRQPGARPWRWRWRATVLIAVHVAAAVHLGHWWVAGESVAPFELSESLHTVHEGVITVGFVFMVVTLLSVVAFGRFFCGWGCHVLALQDSCAWLLRRVGIRPRKVRSRALSWVPFGAAAYLFVWPRLEALIAGDAAPGLHLASDADGWGSLVTRDLLRSFPGLGMSLLTLGVCGFGVVYVLGSRAFCRYACPYGALFSLFDRFSFTGVTLAGDCSNCGQCSAACKSGVDVHREVRDYGRVVSSQCFKDLDCVHACPDGALVLKIGRPPLGRPAAAPSRPELSAGEEVLVAAAFLAALLALRGLYDAVPLLLALALAGLTAWLALVLRRLWRGRAVRALQWELRRGGHLTRAGRCFTAAGALLAVFLGHAAVVRALDVAGGVALREVHRPALADPAARTDPYVGRALWALQWRERLGLVSTPELHRRLASLYLLVGDLDAAATHLDAVLAAAPRDAEALLNLGLTLLQRGDVSGAAEALRRGAEVEAITGPERSVRAAALEHLARLRGRAGDRGEERALLVRSVEVDGTRPSALTALGAVEAARGDAPAAEARLREALRLWPEHVGALNNLAVVLQGQGRRDEARGLLERAIAAQPRDAEAWANLGLIELSDRRLEAAAPLLRRALELDPTRDDARAWLRRIEELGKGP